MKEVKLKSRMNDYDLFGFVDEEGKWVIEPKYEDVHYNSQTEEFEVKINNIYKTIQSDGTLKETSKIYDYITSCRIIQNYGPGGWSFLEASQKDGKWVFDSWERLIYDNEEWYDLRYDEVEEDVERYYDEVEHNEKFAAWANSLNLQTPEEVAELLWANAQQLIEDAKIEQDECLSNLTLWILLYNQLENIKSLGLMDLRKGLGLPEEDEIYRNPDEIRKIAVKLCAELIHDEDGYEYLDFSELVELSRTPGSHNYISEYDFNRGDDDDDDDDDDE